jgi:hypothetical protein
LKKSGPLRDKDDTSRPASNLVSSPTNSGTTSTSVLSPALSSTPLSMSSFSGSGLSNDSAVQDLARQNPMANFLEGAKSTVNF